LFPGRTSGRCGGAHNAAQIDANPRIAADTCGPLLFQQRDHVQRPPIARAAVGTDPLGVSVDNIKSPVKECTKCLGDIIGWPRWMTHIRHSINGFLVRLLVIFARLAGAPGIYSIKHVRGTPT
jgi:hypothetical protein